MLLYKIHQRTKAAIRLKQNGASCCGVRRVWIWGVVGTSSAHQNGMGWGRVCEMGNRGTWDLETADAGGVSASSSGIIRNAGKERAVLVFSSLYPETLKMQRTPGALRNILRLNSGCQLSAFQGRGCVGHRATKPSVKGCAPGCFARTAWLQGFPALWRAWGSSWLQRKLHQVVRGNTIHED